MMPLEVLELKPKKINKLLEKLKTDVSNKSLLGFPSGYEEICKYLDSIKASPIKARIHAIIGMAEALNDYTKQRMEFYFKAPVFSRYSNMENGILAQQTDKADSSFEINWASFYIEVLEFEQDIHVKSGERGRIVVTDLFNKAMPLIRYDTGDIGILDTQTIPSSLKCVEGRKADIIFNTKGEMVSAFIMTSIVQYDGLKQMQLIQNSKKNYTIKYNGDLTKNIKNKIVLDYKKFLGEDANLDLVQVDGIPLLNSGKRKLTINNMNNNN
jgi:phenylacetate-CoA ligase